MSNSIPLLSSTTKFLVSDTKLPVNNPVLLDAWNDICMVMTAVPDLTGGFTYATKYVLNGGTSSPAVTAPSGATAGQLYAESSIIGVTTNKAADYDATIADVNFCSLPLGETLPAQCGGGVA